MVLTFYEPELSVANLLASILRLSSTTLKDLDLTKNDRSHEGEGNFSFAQGQIPSLETLILGRDDHSMGEIPDDDQFEFLKKNRQLKTIILNKSRAVSPVHRLLQLLRTFHQLRQLSITLTTPDSEPLESFTIPDTLLNALSCLSSLNHI